MKLFKSKSDRATDADEATVSPIAVVRRLDTASTARSSKTSSYDTFGNRLLKVAVVFLCTVNALMWEYYTESRMMALVWAAIAVSFVVWIVQDMRR
jgi:membrane protein YdbS with pleckstrin-like domain